MPNTTDRVAIHRAWQVRGVWLGPCAWLLALLGFLLLGDEGSRWFGVALILLGCALAVAAWRHVPPPSPLSASRDTQQPPEQPEASSMVRHVPALIGLALAALLFPLANLQYVADRASTFGPAGVLWLASIGLLAGSCFLWPHSAHAHTSPASDRWPAWEKALFCALISLAAVLRLWDLNNIPFQIMGDEIATGRVALDAYGGHPGPSIFTLLWENIDLPGLWFLTVAKSLEIGGFTLWSLRLPGALFGAATAIPLYGFIRLGWGRGAAITGTALFAFSAVAVHYSRVTVNNIVTPFFWALCFFFLLRGLRSRRPLDWALAGLAGGLSEYAYYGTRLLPFILVAFFGYLLLTNWRTSRAYIGYFGLVALGYLVGFGPLFARYALDPGLYTGRAQGWLSWDHIPVDWADFEKMVSTLWPIIRENMLGISTHGSQDVFYYAPLLLPAEGALLALGVALLAYHWRHPPSFLALFTAIGVVLTGGTLVIYGAAPSLNHWTPAFPAIYAALSVPVGAWLASTASDIPARWRVVAPALTGAGLVVLGLLSVNFYFREYFANPEALVLEDYRGAARYLEVRSAQARYQADLGPQYAVRILGGEEYLHNPDLPYLAQGQDYGPIADPGVELPVARMPGKGLAFLFMPGGEGQRELVRGLHPGGKDGEVRSRTGRHLFYTYLLAPTP
ncbi:MAG: glycosyltransferase family 39 protein [Chloroflexia bacterium]